MNRTAAVSLSRSCPAAPVVPAAQPPLDIDPLTAAVAEQEAKAEQKTVKSLFEKAPVFTYGSAREDITDPGMTFEELRIAKADDFPELGEFIVPKDSVIDLGSVRAGFTPALTLVPIGVLAQIISFFRCYMNGGEQFEAMAHILWDKREERFVVHIPEQTVTKAHIDAELSRDDFPEDRYLHYIDIHSHNSMAAKFSPVDDEDERATRIYIVVGRLDKFFPDIAVRMSCGGAYLELPPGCVLEGFGALFPQEWHSNVKPLSRIAPPALRPLTEQPEAHSRFWRMRK